MSPTVAPPPTPKKAAAPAAPASAASPAPPPHPARPEPSGASDSWAWRDVWQLPALLLALGLLIGGVLASRPQTPGNDFSGALDQVEQLLDAADHTAALDRLNDGILPHLDAPDATTEHRGRFYALRGDALYEKLQGLSAQESDHFRTILANYEEAAKHLFALSPLQQARAAECMLALGRYDDAAAAIRAIPDDEAANRTKLLRRTIERRLASDTLDVDKGLALLAELAADPALSPLDHAWAIARQAELRLEAGRAEEALGHLLRGLNRVDGVAPHDRAEMYLLLAWCYFELGRVDDSRRHIDLVDEMLEPHDPLRSETLYLSGRIFQTNGDLESAHERFTSAIEDFPDTPATAGCALGRAEINAAMGQWAQSAGDYLEAIKRLPVRRARFRVNPESVGRSVSIWWSDRYQQGDYERSIAFATLASQAFTRDSLPIEIPFALGEAHFALGERTLADARGGSHGVRALSDLDPAARVEARAHFLEAGEQFLKHARRVILSDPDSFRESLWRAADAFDRAGESERAIEVFSEYVAGDSDDPRRMAALYRLAQTHQSRGDFDLAARLYRDLIAESPASPESGGARVRLAECLVRNSAPEDDDEAERHLRDAVESGAFKPEAEEFRLALFELASIHYEKKNLPEAIRRLEEAAARYPEDPGISVLRYKLADANRLSAIALDAELESAMPDHERAALQARREEHLRNALSLYETVRAELDAKDPRETTTLDKRVLRNADFYRADCAYDLGDFDSAIRWYDAAAQRYADDPSSLVAMMQIVNAYAARGMWQEAATAQERARQRLLELPADAFESPDLPIEQRHWERWAEVAPRLTKVEDERAPETP